MFRHPAVIAAFILSAGMMISSALICASINSLDKTLQTKPMVGEATTFPDHLNVNLGYSNFGTPQNPLIIKQVP